MAKKNIELSEKKITISNRIKIGGAKVSEVVAGREIRLKSKDAIVDLAGVTLQVPNFFREVDLSQRERGILQNRKAQHEKDNGPDLGFC
ncbi:MAG: hypothetical protein PHC47_03275 [Clostridia bacterium]|nr:hypothetical protein [Clostridia bacterium]